MELVADASKLAIQVGIGAAAVANPWIPLVTTGAHILTTLIFVYTNDQARKEDEEKRQEDDKFCEEQYNDQKKFMQEETVRMRKEDRELFERICKEDQDRRVQEEQRQDAKFAEQRRLLKKELAEKQKDEINRKSMGGGQPTGSGNKETRFEKMIEEFLYTITEKFEEKQEKRAEEEKRRKELLDALERLTKGKQGEQNRRVAETYEQHQQHLERHLATVFKDSDVRTKLNELQDLTGMYEDNGKRYASNPQKMVVETERYERHLGIQIKRVSNALAGGETDVRLLNIWANGAVHHIQILRHLGREGLESPESVQAAIKIHWDTWKRLVSEFNNSLSSTDDTVLSITRYFEEMYRSQELLLGTSDPTIEGRLKNEL